MDEHIVYHQNPDTTRGDFTFVGYVDADYAPDYGDQYCNYKSTTGWIFTVNDVAFSWRSRRQSLLADSAASSEIIAATDASKQNVWPRWHRCPSSAVLAPTRRVLSKMVQL